MLSCRVRDDIRTQTLARLGCTDWGDDVVVVMDDEIASRAQDRQERTARRLLEQAAADCVDFVLFLEDDLDFNRHLRHNLRSWEPLLAAGREGNLLASLYDPGVAARRWDPASAFSVAHPGLVYGSQALLLSRATLLRVVAGWETVAGMQDIKISRIAAAEGPVLYHRPSLVQHVQAPSTWGGAAHFATDFDADWRAPMLMPA